MYFSLKRIIAASIGVPLMVGLEIALCIGKGILYGYEDTINSFLCPPIAIDDDEGFKLSKNVVREEAFYQKIMEYRFQDLIISN